MSHIGRCTLNNATGNHDCGTAPNYSRALPIGFIHSQWDKSETISRVKLGSNLGQRINMMISLNNDTVKGRSDEVVLDVDHIDTFQLFIKDIVEQKSVNMVLRGTVVARVRCGVGKWVEISGVSVNRMVELEGMQELQQTDMLHIVRNFDVFRVGFDSLLLYNVPGAWMRLPSASRRIGLEIDSPLEFKLFFNATLDPFATSFSALDVMAEPTPPSLHDLSATLILPTSNPLHSANASSILVQRGSVLAPDPNQLGSHIGHIILPSLNWGDFAACKSQLFHPYSQLNWTSSDSQAQFCPIAPSGSIQPHANESAHETCEDDRPRRCPTRVFFSSYLSGGGGNGSLPISLQLFNYPPALSKISITLHQVKVPSFTPNLHNRTRPPYFFVRRVVVKPSSSILFGSMWGWLEMYNPLRIPIRIYYFHFDAFINGVRIGSLHVNLTNHDPFSLKPNYTFSGYSPRPNLKEDPFGPHAAAGCVSKGLLYFGAVIVVFGGNGSIRGLLL